MKGAKLEIPEGFDKEVINDWIGEDDTIFEQETSEGGTYCVLVKDEENYRRFLRFFIGGNQTHCSVDWDESSSSADTRLFEMLFKLFTR